MKTIDCYTVYIQKNYEPGTIFEEIIVATKRGTSPIEKLVRKYLKSKYGDDKKFFISSIDFSGDMILDLPK
jgi:hypothetical protein